MLRFEHSSNCDFDLNYGLQLQLDFFHDFELPHQHIDRVSIVLVIYCR